MARHTWRHLFLLLLLCTSQDSSSFASEGEEVSFLQLQARAMEVGQVLVGFYDIPKSVEQPLQLVINPEVIHWSLCHFMSTVCFSALQRAVGQSTSSRFAAVITWLGGIYIFNAPERWGDE